MKRSPLLPIFLIVLVDVLGLTLMIPLLPFYAEHLGATPAVFGLLMATYAGCQLLAGPPLGAWSDRIGRKPVLILSQAGTFVGFLLLASANTLWVVFLARIIDGLTAGNLTVAQAYITDVTRPEERTHSFAIIGIAFGLGFLVGPGASGLLAHHLSLRAPIFASAGLSALSILATSLLLPSVPPRPAESAAAVPAPEVVAQDSTEPAPPAGRRLGLLDWSRYAQFFRRPGLGRLLLQFLLFTLSFATFTQGFALFAERRLTWHGQAFTTREVAYLFSYAGLLGSILQGGLIKRLVKRFGERKLIAAGFFCSAAAYFVLGGVQAIALLVVVTTVSSFGNGVLRPSLTGSITQQVGRSEQGVVLGLTQSLMSIAQIVGPLAGNALIGCGLLWHWAVLAALFAAGGFYLSVTAGSAEAPARA